MASSSGDVLESDEKTEVDEGALRAAAMAVSTAQEGTGELGWAGRHSMNLCCEV